LNLTQLKNSFIILNNNKLYVSNITCLFGITCCIPEFTGILTCCRLATVVALTVGSRICWIFETDDDDWIDGNLITWFAPLLVDTSVPCLKTLPYEYK